MIPDYYTVLGIPRNATKEEIKRAYYRKVKQYHPDRNPSREAHDQFLLIHEAYDALKKGRTQRIQSSWKRNPSDVVGTRQYYERKYRERYQEAYQKRGKRTNYDYATFIKNRTLGKVISWFPVLPLCFIFVLFVDSMLPVRQEVQTVTEKKWTTGMKYIEIVTEQHDFWVNPDAEADFSVDEKVEIHLSPIIGVPELVVVNGVNGINSHRLPNVFNTYFILLIALFIFCVFGISSALAGRQNEMLFLLILLLLWAVLGIMYC